MKLNTTWLIFLCTLTLMTTGVVMVYSASAAVAARITLSKNIEAAAQAAPEDTVGQASSHSSYFLKKQAMWAILSILAMLIAYQFDYEKYKNYAKPILFGSFILLILVFFPVIGVSVKGARRWLNLGFMQLQVSEVAKLALILFMAKKLCDLQKDVKSFGRGFLPALMVLGAFLVMIVIEPDLGAAVMIGVIVFSMMFVGGMRLIHLSTLGILAIPFLVIAILAEPYRMQRLISFMNPEKDIQGKGWQLYQSLISVSTGGITGLGLGEGPQKYLFLSEPHTDFIFAVICEELGMIGALGIFALYTFFIVQGVRVASRAPDLYGTLLATGVTTMIGLQAFVNMYVVVGLLPTKGLTLPLISYGGSSLLINCISIGILMNISRFTEIAAAPARRRSVQYATG